MYSPAGAASAGYVGLGAEPNMFESIKLNLVGKFEKLSRNAVEKNNFHISTMMENYYHTQVQYTCQDRIDNTLATRKLLHFEKLLPIHTN
jgi:hypothetical protein